jgi:HEAT repeat protein
MGTSERLVRLTKVLDQADEKSLQVFKYYASLLGNQAIVPLCEMLGELKQMKSRRILCEAIAEMAQGHVGQLEPATKDPRWFVARNVAYILGMMKNPQGVKYLKELADHGELRVRKEAIRGLGVIGNLESRDFLLACLQSSEEPIQVLAAGTLANLREKRALPVLLKILEEGRFLNRTREYKMEIFDAVGRLGSDQLLPTLRSLLYRKGIFHRSKFEEVREGAALALALIGTEAAGRILEEGAKGDDKDIGRACRAALSNVRFSKRSAEEDSL